jgi:hypothetical protein
MKIVQFFGVIGAVVICSTLQAQESSPAATAKSETAASSPATAGQKADTEWDGVSVELQSVTRGDGDTLTIKWKYTNSGSTEADISKLASLSHDNLAAHVYYIDPGNKKKYLVIKDAQGKEVASDQKYLAIAAGTSRAGWGKFPAPPAGVTKISVYLPGAPPFEGVTIASP